MEILEAGHIQVPEREHEGKLAGKFLESWHLRTAPTSEVVLWGEPGAPCGQQVWQPGSRGGRGAGETTTEFPGHDGLCPSSYLTPSFRDHGCCSTAPPKSHVTFSLADSYTKGKQFWKTGFPLSSLQR